MKSKNYIEKLRPLTKTGSMYAVAKLMGIKDTAVQHYVAGRRTLDNFSCLRVAELLGVHVETVIAEVEIERAKDPVRKAAWKQHCKNCKERTCEKVK